ncbi:DUF4272 domain-containing protein [Paenibacillus sp. FA6]|uniref:DUF4272 domain-containing protein n=1 Tax=Paenibacillus sp. FA6 TaxID=3413029 RepID=UPI003F65B2E7
MKEGSLVRNCALYSSYFDLDQVVSILKSIYPKDHVKVNDDKTYIQVITKKWFSKKIKGFKLMTSHTHPEEFAVMMNGMGNFFSQIPAENREILEKILIKISTLNMVIGIETEDEISDTFFAELLRVVDPLDGLIFWGSDQLLDARGKLLMDLNGASEVKDYTVTAHASFLHGDQNPTESAISRKERSETILFAKEIPYNKGLPARIGDEGTSIRILNEIAQRSVALCIVALKGECICTNESVEETKSLVERVIQQYGATEFFSPAEKAFIEDDEAEEEEGATFSWCYEGLLTMLWALGYVDELEDPVGLCDVPKVVSLLNQFDSYEGFMTNAQLRSKVEILDAADLIYRYHWVCVDSRIHSRETPSQLDHGVVYERHRALNWLIRDMDQEWDKVKTHT